MTHLTASARLKVNRDTWFLPDPNGGAYFRNNSGSFRIKGSSIAQWIEKLLPMFNGEHSLEDLTKGLQAPYRKRVYEIGETLYKNGFVRDVSRDHPHKLESSVLKTYEAQIEFIESFADSGAYRFQLSRQTKVLAAGTGSFLTKLVRSLIDSGFSRIRAIVTDASGHALDELAEISERTESGLEIGFAETQHWREAVRSADWILYVSDRGFTDELRDLQTFCLEENKGFIPGICLKQVGLAGPVFQQHGDGCFEAAWRRLHRSALHEDRTLGTFPLAGKDMLANVIVFELMKASAELEPLSKKNQVYLLDLATLEGGWHAFLPHPDFSYGKDSAELICDLEAKLSERPGRETESRLFQCFTELTSPVTGIFHLWEEKHLRQLPLAQCFVQTADPLSSGPAELLPETISVGLTHQEARREAGLTGIEMYASRLTRSYLNSGDFAIAAGETLAEGVLRGLEKCLEHRLRERIKSGKEMISLVQLDGIEDRHSAFYLKALTVLYGKPEIGLGKNIEGFPVAWAGIRGRWYGSSGLNITLALRKALERALTDKDPLKGADVLLEPGELKLAIPVSAALQKTLLSTLKNNRGLQLYVYELPVEPFLKEKLAGIYCVQLRKEEP
ncbi:putative thiazole-containing bacteriocin maturation protein [Bacillus haynesii]|uniref:putative thiazole-containing bacteriocin maturation protein n=1 Tax=Bacillus haynesii TaxID=1925021 RepID=UPI0022815B21|nr:putative thiazole-containing bacteriocin maturation protein [Bacillus haynesii]MCY8410031.1 putative thiazole-containing bacteriocin maturation protein [Bacillus haynesii]MCY8430988.1 putative thiazole-containing bacteriocin maturation protein [Bacillus haynesii]